MSKPKTAKSFEPVQTPMGTLEWVAVGWAVLVTVVFLQSHFPSWAFLAELWRALRFPPVSVITTSFKAFAAVGVLWAMAWGVMGLAARAGGVRLLPQGNGSPGAAGPVLNTFMDRLLAGLIVFVLAFCLLQTLAPEVFYDTLVYHLAFPKLWLLDHRTLGMPHIVNAGSPAALAPGYAAVLALAGPIGGKVLHFSFGAGTLFLIWKLCERFGSRRAGGVACLLFVSAPLVMHQMGRAATELGTTFLAVATLSALLAALEQTDSRARRNGLLIAGFLCGLCMGTKYPAWIFGPAFAVVILRPPRPEPEGASWKARAADLALFGAAAVVVLAPWLIRNWALYHNPVYPFAASLFGSPFPVDLAGLQNDAGRSLFQAGTGSWLIEPWTLSLQAAVDQDFLGPMFLALAPWAFLRARPPLRTLLWVFAVSWILLSVFSRPVRFRIPSLAILSILIGLAIESDAGRSWVKSLQYAVVILLAAINFALTGALQWRIEGWRVVLGAETAEAYLSRTHDSYPSPYFPAAEFINNHTPASAKVMVLGDARGFYLERPFVTASIYDSHPLIHAANELSDGEALYARLKDLGITHLLMNVAEAARLDFKTAEDLTARGQVVLDDFWKKHLRRLFEDRDLARPQDRFCVVYELVADRMADPKAPDVGPNYPVMIFQQRDRVKASRRARE